MKPSIFIGSSTEGIEVAYAIQANLESVAEPTVWDQGVFEPTTPVLTSLIRSLRTFDFAMLVLTPDDVVKIRSATLPAARDNVVFELGLFIGSLGEQRTFFVLPRSNEPVRLPTDLAGVQAGSYDHARKDGNLRAALGPACQVVRSAIKALGPRTSVPPGNTQPEAPTAKAPFHRQSEILVNLRDFVAEAESIRDRLLTKGIEVDEADEQLIRWKTRVCRFLDKNLGFPQAKAFLSLHTSLRSAQEGEHFRSAFRSHIRFLETICVEIEDDSSYPFPAEPKSSGKLVLGNISFTYAPQ